MLTQEAILVGLPVVLPLLALYASRKREKAVLEVCTHICIESSPMPSNLTLDIFGTPLCILKASSNTKK